MIPGTTRKTPSAFTIWGLLLAQLLVIATLLLNNYSLRYDVHELKGIARALVLAVVRQDTSYQVFARRFPDTQPWIEDGSARWSQAVKQDGTTVVYSCHFDLRSLVRLSQWHVAPPGGEAVDTRRFISRDEFLAATDDLARGDDAHAIGEGGAMQPADVTQRTPGT